MQPSREIVMCPTCLGKPALNAFEQVEDAPCGTCGGIGIVYNALCQCGRPAIRVEGGKYLCGFEHGGETVANTTGAVTSAPTYEDWPASWYGR